MVKSLLRLAKLYNCCRSWSHNQIVREYSCGSQFHPQHTLMNALLFTSFEVLFSELINIYILKYIISLFLLQVFLALILEKHVSFNMWFIEIFVVCTNWIICEMDEFIADLLRIIVNRWKTNIALVEHPNG